MPMACNVLLKFAALCWLCLAIVSMSAQASGRAERGLPLVHNFTPKEYAAHGQNWAIVQDQRGVIYSANTDGVLEFDGLRWRLIRTTARTVVRSLAVDANGRVYVGALGDFGYLAADAAGRTQYVSLLDRVPEAARDFDDVHHIFVTPRGVYFESYARLLRLQGDTVKVWNPGSAFHRAFMVRDQLYVREHDRGLLRLNADDELELAPGGERFASERVDAMLPWEGADAETTLIGTRTQGLFVLDGDALTPFLTDVGAELARDSLYSAARLADGTLALGTIQGGVYLLDRSGKLIGRLDKTTGLQDNTVYAMTVDGEGGLWLGHDRGLARVAVGALTVFDERAGLAGSALVMRRHQGTLFVGTAQGLFRLSAGAMPRFGAIPGIKGQTYDLLPWGDTLLVANNEGTYAVRDDTAVLVQRGKTATAMALLASTAVPGRVYVGLWDGLASVRFEQGRWFDEGRVPGITEDVSSLLELPDGTLWTGSAASPVLHIRFPEVAAEAPPGTPVVARFTASQGLPGPADNYIQRIDGEMVWSTKQGIYRFNGKGFEPDPRFATLFPEGPRWVMYATAEDAERRVWMQTAEVAGGVLEAGAAVPLEAGGYRWDPMALRPALGAWVEKVHADDDGIVWLGGAEGLFRLDPKATRSADQAFAAIVRQVGAPDLGATLFGGAGAAPQATIDYENNAVRFEYAAPSFAGIEANRFQVFLEGNDRDWSAWSAEGFREYTNLKEGRYRFRVRAKNLYGALSSEATYAFSVLPPWYRTWWSYLAYAGAVMFIGWALLRWRMRRVEGEKHALELNIAARTSELRVKNAQLEAAREQAEAQRNAAETLRERAEEANRSKSVFLANMSHELRTPLNGVLGFAQLMDRTPERSSDDRKHLATILRSGEHLLGLINDVLSLSKIEAGGLTLSEAPFELEALLAGVGDLMRVRADAKDLWLRLEHKDLPRVVHGDAQKLSQILLNLLGNAVKFTARGGVTLRAYWAGEHARFEVEDTGAGIAADEIGQLFAPFVQSASGRDSKEGTGLGLVLSRQMARLMGGDITLTSTLGRGTTVCVALPLPACADNALLATAGEHRRVRSLAPAQPPIRVLVVDDVADNRALLCGLLQAVGFEVRDVADGAAAITLWRSWQPHLIWMDKRMPGMDGTEAARRIRAEEAHSSRARVAILALSASALEHERAEILASGCDDFVPKPFRESLIFAKLGEFAGAVYVYDDELEPALKTAATAGLSARVNNLPSAWRHAMRHALAIGDTARARQLVDEIELEEPALAVQMRAMLAAYRLDELEQMFAHATTQH